LVIARKAVNGRKFGKQKLPGSVPHETTNCPANPDVNGLAMDVLRWGLALVIALDRDRDVAQEEAPDLVTCASEVE